LKIKRKNGKKLSEELSELQSKIIDSNNILTENSENLKQLQKDLSHLTDLEKNEIKLRNDLEESTLTLNNIQKEIEELTTSKTELSDSLLNIKDDVSIYKPILDLINTGFVQDPEYLFDTSERFKEEIKIIREQQKKLISEKNAISIPETIALTSNNSYSNKILNSQSQLMLKAFNIECDLLMSKVKTSNYPKILERIDKLAAAIEKLSLSLKCGFNTEYVELKFKECELQYQFKLKDAREKEEQAIIKEQMREEQKAIREFERALAKAQKEEKMYKDALETARKELEISTDKDKQKLMDKIALLEKKLLEAEENEKRAMSMAEQTKRGHVYVISNIGSFGENIYKIGLTRRLEPMDRIKELGSASVPFGFDVHAMIFSDDAPALESQLHREFSQFRVNQVKLRKEFFNVDLLQIRDKATELTGNELDFKVTALAEDYYESLKIRNQSNVV